MFILIIGGGKVGYYLAKTLLLAGHEAVIIEVSSERCDLIAKELDLLVINGDGTDIEILEEANIGNAGYVVAVTGKDEENLVVCQLAKKYFQVPRTIARVNNPKNQAIFKKLGVDATVSSTGAIARLIENQLALDDLKRLPLFDEEGVELIETELKANSPVVTYKVKEIALPEECVLMAVYRNGSIVFPRGDTVLLTGDRIFALAKKKAEEKLKALLLGGSR